MIKAVPNPLVMNIYIKLTLKITAHVHTLLSDDSIFPHLSAKK